MTRNKMAGVVNWIIVKVIACTEARLRVGYALGGKGNKCLKNDAASTSGT
jgi:hypothetical protein